jgi:hypothetical protein
MTPPHIHPNEDETFIVLEGELILTIDGTNHPGPAGSVISVPRGSPDRRHLQGTDPVHARKPRLRGVAAPRAIPPPRTNYPSQAPRTSPA